MNMLNSLPNKSKIIMYIKKFLLITMKVQQMKL